MFRNALALAVLTAFIPAVSGGPAGAQSSVLPLEFARFSVRTPAGPVEPAPEVLHQLKPLVYTEHEFRYGEWNIYKLARRYGTSVPSLQFTNNDELVLIKPGSKILVHNKLGLLYLVKRDSESLDSIVARYEKDPSRARKLKEKAVDANELPGTALIAPYHFLKGQYVLLPGARLPSFDTYQFPFKNPGWTRISSGFGMRFHPILHLLRRHDGWDLPKPYGTPVYAARSGRVVYSGWKEGYGNMVEIRHSDRAATIYGHLSKIYVVPGQWVQKGHSLLGRVGSSGLSTGPHLHFEVRDSRGRAVDPRRKIGRR